MSAPAYLSQLLRQLCSFLQAFGLLRLHAGRLQPLLWLLMITLPSHTKSVPELQRCRVSQTAVRHPLRSPWVARPAPAGPHDNPMQQRHILSHYLSDSILNTIGWLTSAGCGWLSCRCSDCARISSQSCLCFQSCWAKPTVCCSTKHES